MGAVNPRPAFCVTLLPATPRHGPAFPPQHPAHCARRIVQAVGRLGFKETSQDKRWFTATTYDGHDNNLFLILNREPHQRTPNMRIQSLSKGLSCQREKWYCHGRRRATWRVFATKGPPMHWDERSRLGRCERIQKNKDIESIKIHWFPTILSSIISGYSPSFWNNDYVSVYSWCFKHPKISGSSGARLVHLHAVIGKDVCDLTPKYFLYQTWVLPLVSCITPGSYELSYGWWQFEWWKGAEGCIWGLLLGIGHHVDKVDSWSFM